MADKKENRSIITGKGEEKAAAFPVIVSASRGTDIPAFYADWFFERLKKGYSAWINPFNRKKSYISYQDCKFIVFWSKNPKPLLNHIDYLNKKGIGCYVQFSLNDYENEKLEANLPPLAHRIETFRALADKLGKDAVIWRFDPLLLTDDISIDVLLARIRDIGRRIHEYTEKLVFSFADILSYAKVKANLGRQRIAYRDWTLEQMHEFSGKLAALNKCEGWNLSLAACCETAALDAAVERGRCVDDRLILRLSKSPEVWQFLGAEPPSGEGLAENAPKDVIALGNGEFALMTKNNKDRGQRKACGCVKSKDIGQYDTCPHLCSYCYANSSREIVLRNVALHKATPRGELITG